MSRLPWHPVLFAVVVVLTAWLDAAVSPYAAMRSLVVAMVCAVIVTGIAGVLLRSAALGAIATSVMIGLLWSRQLIEGTIAAAGRMGWFALVWVILLSVTIILVARAWRRASTRVTRAGATSVLNRAGVILLVVTLGLGVARGRLAAVGQDLGQGVPLESVRASEAEGRDLYVILLDGYPRADVLEYAFNIDNTPFLDALAARGFEVAGASHSDYLWTHVSVPSALNLAYVEDVPGMLDVSEGRAPRQPTLRMTVADNVAFDVAHEHGYTTVAVGSGFEEVAPRLADVYVDGGQLNEFEITLLTSTFAGDLLNVVAPDFASSQQRDRISHNLDVLGDIAAADFGPKLVFAHVPAPHQPSVFGEDGAPVTVPLSHSFFADSPGERGEDPDSFIQRYRAELPYLNERILQAVDAIVGASSERPAIVLFADHGSASAVDWNATRPEEADPARLLERTGTLFAAMTPGEEDVFPDDITPVDLFRLLFDAYLGTDYGRVVPPKDGGQVPPVDPSTLGPPS